MSFALQTAVYNALVGDVTLMALISGVFDNPPENYDSFPYITIGEEVSTDFSTDDSNGVEVVFVVHVWSRQNGARKEAKQIIDQVYTVLNRSNLTVTGFNNVLMQYNSDQTVLDPDGLTVHGMIDFRAILFRS